MHKILLAVILVTTVTVGGCGGPRVYRQETFEAESPFKADLNVSAQKACEAAQLALLSQGYRLESTEPYSIKARKDFQPETELNAVIEFSVVCKDYLAGSILFANAVQTSYELKKSRQSTSISVPTAGSLSLPLGKTTESLVKISGETISDKAFYARFFALVQSFIDQPGKSNK